jgi:predicted dehydrogenase
MRVAIVGARGVGAMHARALEQIPGAELALVVGSSDASAAEVGRRLKVPSTSNFEDVLEPGIDVVHVCTPNSLHYAQTREALIAGKHVVCEKPLTTTSEDALELARIASVAVGKSTVCYNYRFLPLVLELRQQLEKGALGRIYSVRAQYLQNWRIPTNNSDWRSDWVQSGGSRVIGDIGTHLVDLCEFLTGTQLAASDIRVGAAFEPLEKAHDDFATIQGCLGEAVAVFQLSQVSPEHTNTLSISLDGSKGGAEWTFNGGESLTLTQTASLVQLSLNGNGVSGASGRYWTRLPGEAPPVNDLLGAFYADLHSSGRSTSKILPTLADAARHVELIEQAGNVIAKEDRDPAYESFLK